MIDDSAGLLDAAEYDGVMESMKEITQYCNVGFYTYAGGSTEYVKTKAQRWGDGTFTGDYTLFNSVPTGYAEHLTVTGTAIDGRQTTLKDDGTSLILTIQSRGLTIVIE